MKKKSLAWMLVFAISAVMIVEPVAVYAEAKVNIENLETETVDETDSEDYDLEDEESELFSEEVIAVNMERIFK